MLGMVCSVMPHLLARSSALIPAFDPLDRSALSVLCRVSSLNLGVVPTSSPISLHPALPQAPDKKEA